MLEAEAPYKEWKSRHARTSTISPATACHTFKGVTYLLTRTMDYGKRAAGQAIYTYEKDGTLQALLRAARRAGLRLCRGGRAGRRHTLVSWYSGPRDRKNHDQCNIYVAVVPLVK